MVKFHLLFYESLLPQVNAQIQIKNEQSIVQRQIEEPNGDEILWIRYPHEAYETRNPMKPKSNDLDLISGRNPCSKLVKISTQIWAKRWTIWWI